MASLEKNCTFLEVKQEFFLFSKNRKPPLKQERGPNLLDFGSWRASSTQFHPSKLKIELPFKLKTKQWTLYYYSVTAISYNCFIVHTSGQQYN